MRKYIIVPVLLAVVLVMMCHCTSDRKATVPANEYLIQGELANLSDSIVIGLYVDEGNIFNLVARDTLLNGQRSGQFFIIQRVPVRPVIHRFHSGNRGNKGFRTGAKYQVLTFVSLLTAADCILIYDLCFSRYYRDIVRSQLRLHPQYQFTHHFALTDNNLG